MQFDRRTIKDRRQKPTPLLSKYTLWGRRRSFRRKEDRERGGYVDRYHPGMLFLLILVAGLNILDAFFTLIILDYGGWELNPVVYSVINILGDNFWIWKFGLVSLSLVLLCLHSKFKVVKILIFFITTIYLGVLFYHIRIILNL